MRILFCTNSLGVFGGIERVTIVKANALAEIPGNEVAICYTDRGDFPKTIHPLSDKVKVYDLRTPYWGFTSIRKIARDFIKTVLATRRALLQVVDGFKPDVIISTGSYEKFAVASIPSNSLKKHGGGNTLKIREFHFGSNYRRFLGLSRTRQLAARIAEFFEYRILSRWFDKTFVLTKADLKENFRDNRRFDYMYNPCSFSGKQAGIPEREKTVLAVGRLSTQKNFSELVSVWSRVVSEAPGWRLRIIGGGDSVKKQLEDLALELGISDSVELPGQSNRVDEEMGRASVFVMTSLYEGMPLVLIEALNAGLPIVSYRTPYGPDEIVRDGTDGYIVGYRDTEQLRDRLLELIHDDNLRVSMGKNGYERSKVFHADKIAARWMQKYSELLSQKNK